MSEKTLKSGNVIVDKKEFHASKQAIPLNLVDTDKILSDKFKHNDKVCMFLSCHVRVSE